MISKTKLTLLAACGCLMLCRLPARGADDPFAENIRTTNPNSPADEQKMFHLPPGFEIQLVASEPDIEKPLNMQFDDKGRLWLSETTEYPFPSDPPARPKKDKILILSDFAADGHAQSIKTFATGLDIPIGIYPLVGGGCIGYSIPKIWHMYDDNHDDKMSRMVPLYGDFNDHDTHGMTNTFRRGYDGWIYANHGFNNVSTVKGSDGQAFTMHSGNTYRFKLDGTHAEQVTWGQINPFGGFFDPIGDRFDSDSHSKPFYDLLRGGHYECFDRPDDILGEAPRMMNHLHGSTAIAGACGYFAEEFPPEYRGNFLVGNVVTCRINRDTISYHGSSPVATEAPDFLYTDDPWFRPNDIQLGPDGALYVCDFYNRIIGHYEVPLTNPLRDYKRGRIWRIVYTGNETHAPLKAPRQDWSTASLDDLITDLNDPNLQVRMTAMNEIADRVGPAAADALKKVMIDGTGIQKRHALWDLRRIGALTDDILKAAANDKDYGVRVHAMRVLGDLPKWNDDEHAMALAGLADTNPFVQRCAADAMGLHPSFENLRPMLDLRENAPPDDTHLIYTLRLAIRDHCKVPGILPQLEKSNLSPSDIRAIMDVAPGVGTPEAADFLIDHLDMAGVDHDTLEKYVTSAVTQIEPDHLDAVVDAIRKNFSDDVDLQLELLSSLEEGVMQRGATLSPAARSWGEDLARQILTAKNEANAQWTNHPLPNAKTKGNPWTLQQRNCADGKKGTFLTTSFDEPMTGQLTSKPFTIPEKLTFFLAGHNGFPDTNPPPMNFFRLRDAQTNQVLREALPPRNDMAQKITWDLKDVAGKQGYLEAYDGDEDGAYAWIAFGRLQPRVVPMPKMSPSDLPRRQAAAADLVARWHLDSLKDPMTAVMSDPQTDEDLRRSIATALLSLGSEAGLPILKQSLLNPSTSEDDDAAVATALGADKSPAALGVLVDTFNTATDKLQMNLAIALTASSEGSEALLAAIQAGKAPARLLQEQNILDRLAANKVNNLDARVKQLTKGMPPLNDKLIKLVNDRRAVFAAATNLDTKHGQQIFQKNCMICHSLDGKGALIGPQLDGIGQRGPNRVIEDVLDPNRNVDPAFRYSTVILKDETIITGLQKRDEGQTLYFADTTGKLIPVQKSDIKKRFETNNSLMPPNFGDVLKPDDFNDLIAFLMTKRVGPAGLTAPAPTAASGH